MDEYATRLAFHLIRLGVATYDRVIMQLFNTPQLVYAVYACLKIGTIPICTLPTHRWSEISFLAKESEARVHIIPAGTVKDFDYEAFAEEIKAQAPDMKFILAAGKPSHQGIVSIDELIHQGPDLKTCRKELQRYRPDPMQPAFFQLSGGTTGTPKIIPRTHNDYYYNAKCSAEALEYNETSRVLVTMPLMHNAPMINVLLPVHLKGGCVALMPSLAPESILQAVEENKPDILLLIHVHMMRILSMPDEVRQKYDYSSIRRLMGGWNQFDPDTSKIFDLFDCTGVATYGMAEGLVCWSRWSDPREIWFYTDGRPVSEADETRVVDPATGERLPAGEKGEMQCRGPYTIRGYFNAPQRNKEAFTSDGFYRTGDLVTQDADGYITWRGRIKDCIDRGAEKINAEEVEGHIVTFPKVKEVAVVGMPDKEMGERICAFVVPQPGATFALDELQAYLLNERSIARFKLPERLEFIDALPLTKVGKFEKKSLREQITKTLKAEGKI
jgi:2,3-dihydroxybenzoate-AMP ligase